MLMISTFKKNNEMKYLLV